MKMKNLDIEMHNTLDITNMTQKEIEEAIHSVISGEKTFAEVAAENPGPSVTIEEPTDV
jgi:MinD-like ATPase involved in chromosome partitioning or flagellar assembly|tara:strand:+ start:126 stop:302 length:177 start_codon:yes stop_codon:yes gene_type:complete